MGTRRREASVVGEQKIHRELHSASQKEVIESRAGEKRELQLAKEYLRLPCPYPRRERGKELAARYHKKKRGLRARPDSAGGRCLKVPTT